MDINALVLGINNFIWGWPLIIYIMITGTIVTIGLGFVQFRHFIESWKCIISPQSEVANVGADMTPLQAFVNALSSSLGNGSIAGMATAVYSGGPGAAFWIFIFGLFGMALRFAEVFLGSYYPPQKRNGLIVGGPMVYLTKVPGKTFLPYLYAFFLFLLSLGTGNAMQSNSVRLSIVHLTGLDYRIVALALLAFVIYIMTGGAQRIIKVSDRIVPVKVGAFFISAFIVLAYHYASIIPALKLIITGAFVPQALAGGALGYTIQSAMRFGFARTANASEAGLGSAAVLFGGSGSKQPVRDAIMSMAGTFISANLVCFSVALMVIASGVWNNGLTSTLLTTSAYETVFGSLGSFIITFLTVSFGFGVLVSYAYIARVCWIFLTGGRFLTFFAIFYCAWTLLGAIADVSLVWNITDLSNSGLLLINLFAIVWLLPEIRRSLKAYQAKQH